MDPDVFNIDDLPVPPSRLAAVASELASWFSDPITPPADPTGSHPSRASSSAPIELSSDWAALTQDPIAGHARRPARGRPGSGRPAGCRSACDRRSRRAVAAAWSAPSDGPQVEELVRALDTGQFWVAYQPIIALGTGEITGVEALARWAHPHRGDLSPQEFLPLAERHGLAGRLDGVIFLDAVKQVSAWNAARAAAGARA